MKIITIDKNGKVTGIYDRDVHGIYNESDDTWDMSHIPAPYVEVNDDVAQEIYENKVNHYMDDEFVFIDTRDISLKKEDILRKFNEDMKAMVEKYPVMERETWSMQKEEAVRYLDTKDANVAPLLSAIIAKDKNTSLADIATSVLAKAEAFSIASGKFIAKKNADLAALEQ